MKNSDSELHPLRAPESAATWYDRLLDGPRLWGSVDVFPPRYGFHKYRLVVFPPGISSIDRRLVRAWRSWPVWGTIGWLLSVVCLNSAMSPDAAAIFSLLSWAAVGAVAFAVSAAARAQTRIFSVVLISGHHDEDTAAKLQLLKELSSTLVHADHMLSAGELSPVGHELVWSQVYDQLEAATSR